MEESPENKNNEPENTATSTPTKKNTLKILAEVDKEIIKDLPPNFTTHNYTRIHDSEEGKLHG